VGLDIVPQCEDQPCGRAEYETPDDPEDHHFLILTPCHPEAEQGSNTGSNEGTSQSPDGAIFVQQIRASAGGG